MKRMILSLIAAGLILTGASSVRAADWYDDWYGYDAGYAVRVYRAPIYAVPRYRVPLVAPVVRPVVRPLVRAPIVAAVPVVRTPVAVVRRVAPVARATRFVGRRVLLRY